MTLDETSAELALRLRPLVAPLMTERQLLIADVTIDAGEGYEALKWLFDATEDEDLAIPHELVEQIRDCIQPEDMEEYAPLIASQLRRG